MIIIGESCGDIICERGEECCLTCDDEGNMVPANVCTAPMMEGVPGIPCPVVQCIAPPISEPPITVDPPSMKCSSINHFL